ncbi:hypothetical protein N9J72_00185 [Candidatus Gracilibacteria bacterium]|nr:hypothetical protein [Candidatus Gracilibacteria bacterium]
MTLKDFSCILDGKEISKRINTETGEVSDTPEFRYPVFLVTEDYKEAVAGDDGVLKAKVENPLSQRYTVSDDGTIGLPFDNKAHVNINSFSLSELTYFFEKIINTSGDAFFTADFELYNFCVTHFNQLSEINSTDPIYNILGSGFKSEIRRCIRQVLEQAGFKFMPGDNRPLVIAIDGKFQINVPFNILHVPKGIKIGEMLAIQFSKG